MPEFGRPVSGQATASARSSGRWGFWAALALGGAMPLGFAPFHLWWLPPLLLLGLCRLWDRASPRDALRTGFAFGIGQFLAGTHWTYISIHVFAEAPAWLAVVLMFTLVLAVACYFALVGWLVVRVAPRAGVWRWLAVFPAAWVLIEWWRGWFLTGFGWLAQGYAQTDSVLAGWAPVLGIYGASLAVVLSAGALRALFVRGRARWAAAAVLAAVWLGGAVLHRVEWTQARPEPVSVALLQASVPQDIRLQAAHLPNTLQLYWDLTQQSLGRDLIIWPESALAPALAHEVWDYLQAVGNAVEQAGGLLLTGATRYDLVRGEFENTLVALGSDPRFYLKRHLVPFGEYFPVPDWVREWMRRMELPHTNITPGNPGQPVLHAGGERLALTICYEDLFGSEQLHYYPEATLLINVSNDAWFGNSIAPHQHLQIARMRSLEGRRPMLRATNTGISAIIDPFGRVVARSPQFEPYAVFGEVYGREGYTPYARWGNWAVVSPVVLVLLAGGFAGWRRAGSGAAGASAKPLVPKNTEPRHRA